MSGADRGFGAFQRALEELIRVPSSKSHKSLLLSHDSASDYLKDFYSGFLEDYCDDNKKLLSHKVDFFNYGASLVKKKQAYDESLGLKERFWAFEKLAHVRGFILQRNFAGIEGKKEFYQGRIYEQNGILSMYQDIFGYLKDAVMGFEKLYFPLCALKNDVSIADFVSNSEGEFKNSAQTALKSSLFSFYLQWCNYAEGLNSRVVNYDRLNRRFRCLNDFMADLSDVCYNQDAVIKENAELFFENANPS